MANLQVRSEPKNGELLWLQGQQNQHRSYTVFQGVENPLKSRRCDQTFWDHMKSLENEEIQEEVFNYIRQAGFGGVFKTGFHRLDHALITALVERWRPETHTFHFPIGEATITLQDVQVLWGLPIDGPVVSGTWVSMGTEQWIYTCYEHLGFVLEEEDIKASRMKISTLLEHLDDPLEDNEVAYRQRARMYLLAMFAGHLFVDSSQHDVSLNFLENLDDLSIEGRKSWGSAVLASLYRNLCKATNPNCKGIHGALLLLQYWAWERMPNIAPAIIRGDTYNYQHCYAARWDFTLSHTDAPGHVLITYRSAFTALTNEQFIWTPYDQIIHLLPEDCREGRPIWAYSGFVVFWNVVEPHLAHRVTRQFGYIQSIPGPYGLLAPQKHSELHDLKRIGGRNVDWVLKLEEYVSSWNQRHNRIFVGEPGVTTTPDYMQWYHDRTVLCVMNPGQAGPRNRYPEWGGTQQLYQEGLREIQHRAQQAIDRDPTQSSMFQDFVQLPRQMMQFGHYEERMNYASQNFEFPTSAYHPGPSGGGGYYPGTENPGNYPGNTNPGYFPGSSNPGNYPGNTNPGYFPGSSYPGNHPIVRSSSPSTPYNLFNIPNNALSPDFQMDPNYLHLQMGRQRPHVTPIPMRNWSNVGTSGNPSGSRNVDITQPRVHLSDDDDDDEDDDDDDDNDDDDDDDDEDEEPEQRLPYARERRRIRRPGCGTGGHR